jgi:hypothetical protein
MPGEKRPRHVDLVLGLRGSMEGIGLRRGTALVLTTFKEVLKEDYKDVYDGPEHVVQLPIGPCNLD